MRVLRLGFAGSATGERDAMRRLLTGVLGLEPSEVAGVDGDAYRLPDGSLFVVAPPGSMGAADRALGFEVDDLDAAAAALRSAGVTPGEVRANDAMRYLHFTGPDGLLYELVERTG